MLVHVVASDSDYPFDAHCWHIGTAIKYPVKNYKWPT